MTTSYTPPSPDGVALTLRPFYADSPGELTLSVSDTAAAVIKGTVELEDGVPADGANVVAVDQNTKSVYRATTDGDGEYQIGVLPGGTFHVMVRTTINGELRGDQTRPYVSVPAADSIPSSGVSRWTFNDADTSGSTASDVWGANDGTINGIETGVSGILPHDKSGAYSASGSGGVSTGLSLPPTCTLSLWADPGQQAESRAEMISTRSGGSGVAVRLQNSQTEWNAYVNDGSFRSVGYVGAEKRPTHLAFVIDDGTEIALYIDGVLRASRAIGARNIGSSAELFRSSEGGNNFIGSIDDPRVYDRVLTSAEIQQLYQVGYFL